MALADKKNRDQEKFLDILKKNSHRYDRDKELFRNENPYNYYINKLWQ